MEKLIELLNEYDDGMVSWYEEYFSTEGLFVTNAGQGFREEFILGKRYGFIKRLVENDKIDYWKIGKKIGMDNGKAQFPINKYWYVYDMEMGSISSADYSDYESLLMLLSIQNNPIEFLISILK